MLLRISKKKYRSFASKLSKFMKSIRFRMTFIYSSILFVFSAFIVLVLNFYLLLNVQQVPPPRPDDRPDFPLISEELSDEERQKISDELQRIEDERLEDIRRDDLNSFLEVSVYSLFPMAILSFLIGYYVSGNLLNPLSDLNDKVKKLKVERLGTILDRENEDEIGDLVASFNEMSVRLEKAFNTQSEFIQNAAHELKTPLSVVTINLDTILDDEDATEDELRKCIQNSLNGIDQINLLTEKLLSLSTPIYINDESFSLNNLVTQQIDSLKVLAAEKSVTLDLNISKENLMIHGDRVSLGRAFYNVIENAIKYSSVQSSESTKPTVSIKLCEVSSQYEVTVIDNGPGITSEHQDRIFERFYRTDKARSRKEGGFGLGLAITKKIVDDHGGTISLKSSPGNTEMKIVLRKPVSK